MNKNLLVTLLFLLAAGTAFAQHKFRFNNDGKFKIVQFTDIHWDPTSAGYDTTRNTILSVLSQEKPDIAILTGDIVTANPAKKGWEAIIKIFEEAKMPFAVTLGNHDAEPQYMSKQEIFDELLKSPYFVGSHGPQGIPGHGQYVIPVYGSKEKDKVQSLLYCIDSNDYPETDELGHYDWIHFEQIAWYRDQSKHYTDLNGGTPLPALAFFHIALPEYRNLMNRPGTWGRCDEGEVCAADINSGMFASFAECKDVMGVFVGHDHDNEFIGQEKGICLAYGRVTGTDAYGGLVRGGRVIEMYEGERRFDSWVTTPQGREFAYYYPSGITSIDEEGPYLPALNVKPKKQGVNYTYYEGKFKKTADIFNNGKKMKEGVLNNFIITEARSEDHFGYDFRSFIKIPEKGVYYFDIASDDGSRLFIDGKEIIDNDGSHSQEFVAGKVALEAGFHEMRIIYFEDYMGQSLKIKITDRYNSSRILPDDMLYTK